MNSGHRQHLIRRLARKVESGCVCIKELSKPCVRLVFEMRLRLAMIGLTIAIGALALHQLALHPRADVTVHTSSSTVAEAESIENLVLLGRIWGFVKYHHPRVARGEVDWDAELLRVVPHVERAADRDAAVRIIAEWLSAVLGDPVPCAPCAVPPDNAYLTADLDWIYDRELLGENLSHRLTTIYHNRYAGLTQRYVSLATPAGNPDFSAEASYDETPLPTPHHRLLALYRLWNIVQYWYPYREVAGQDWDSILAEFIPRLFNAADATRYRLELMQLFATINDSHANLWSEIEVRPPQGTAQIPVIVRFLDGRAVVAGYAHLELGPASGLQLGDIVTELDGRPVDSMVTGLRPYYGASNEAGQLRDIAMALTRGPPGPVQVRVQRGGTTLSVSTLRVPMRELDLRRSWMHDLGGDPFTPLRDDVVYLRLSGARAADVDDYIRRAQHAKVFVVDARGYSADFVVYALGRHLVRAPISFASSAKPDPSNPGAFIWARPAVLRPFPPRFTGKVVILVDETTQSRAEYTVMALRETPGSLVVGSRTAGANGNVSTIPLPGGVRGAISGIAIATAHGRATQRVGIIPDVVVYPTAEGIRAERDEVLERGVSVALGKDVRLPIGQ